MSESESFLARWSRLKGTARREGVDGSEMGTDPSAVPEAPEVLAKQTSVPPAIDLENLPALRNAWVADPAIRDFVEIADNQWDFNDATAMPGFGSLGTADYARTLVTRASTDFSEAEANPGLPPVGADANLMPPARAAVAGPQIIDEVWKVGTAAIQQSSAMSGAPPMALAATDGQAALERPHGTALPK